MNKQIMKKRNFSNYEDQMEFNFNEVNADNKILPNHSRLRTY